MGGYVSPASESLIAATYMHRFYSHQPDLNVANPEVRDEIAQTVGFWLEQGLSGFRVDAYGEEIGMAENLAIEGRYSVRAPMQWSAEPHAGFSTADGEPCRPLVGDGPFGFSEVNVTSRRRDPGSLLNWMERLIRRRRECPELGWGTWTC